MSLPHMKTYIPCLDPVSLLVSRTRRRERGGGEEGRGEERGGGEENTYSSQSNRLIEYFCSYTYL